MSFSKDAIKQCLKFPVDFRFNSEITDNNKNILCIHNAYTEDFFMQWGKVEICGINTSDLKVLKETEKRELLEKARKGNTRAREQLIQGNLRLVLSVIQRFVNRGENLDDLFQVGCIGLIKAVDNFDINQPVRFSTYAVPMIIGELRRYLRDYNAVRVSRSMKDTAYHAMQIREKIQNEQNREATIEEIAELLEKPREQVVLSLEAIVEPVSLYEPVYSDGGDTIYVMDQIGDNSSETDWIDEMLIKQSIKNLSDREKSILNMRFMKGMTQMEVATEVGISQAQVSRLEKSAINKIKNNE